MAASYVRAAAQHRAELATTPYFCGALVALFRQLCRDHDIAVVQPFYERDENCGCFHNSVVGIGRDGSCLATRGRRATGSRVRKLHLSVGDDPAGFGEAKHFTPGGDFGIFALEGCEALLKGREIGPYFPAAFARVMDAMRMAACGETPAPPQTFDGGCHPVSRGSSFRGAG